MKIKVGDLRKIIREVAEEAAGGSASLDALTRGIDDLASTWKEWSATVTSDTGFTKYGDAASNIDAVRVLRKDQGTDRWDPAAKAAATKNADAAAWVAAADALPWPSDDVALKVAIMGRWVEDHTGAPRLYADDAAYITAAGFEPPTAGVSVKGSMSDLQIAGVEWMRLMLGVRSGEIFAAKTTISKAYADSRAPARKTKGRR